MKTLTISSITALLAASVIANPIANTQAVNRTKRSDAATPTMTVPLESRIEPRGTLTPRSFTPPAPTPHPHPGEPGYEEYFKESQEEFARVLKDTEALLAASEKQAQEWDSMIAAEEGKGPKPTKSGGGFFGVGDMVDNYKGGHGQ